jgi:protein gp37
MSVTSIEWTKRPGTIGETWNPTTGCNKVDRGCKNCYAEIMHRRLQAMGQHKYRKPFLDGAKIHTDTLDIPLRWNKPRTVFVNSMSDLFHEDVPFQFIGQVFSVMQKTPQHTYLVLTKRPELALKFWNLWLVPAWGWWPANVWIGTSANDQQSGERRIPILANILAPVRFLSYEPATGPLDLSVLPRLDWVIAGGESGPKATPPHIQWFRDVRNYCLENAVPFFFKQWGTWSPIISSEMTKIRGKSFNVLDGETYQEFPKVPVILTHANTAGL